MKPLARNANIEDLIADLAYYEDPDQMLLVSHDGKGTFYVSDQCWDTVGKGPTLKDALLEYGRASWKNDSEYAKFDYE